MSIGEPKRVPAARTTGACLLALALALAASQPAQAQVVVGAVGGVHIDTAGMLTNADVDTRGELQQLVADALKAVPEGLDQPAAMRKISLRGLDAAIGQCLQSGQELPDAIRYLAGLQQIEYVVVCPEQNDIVLIGPGDRWTVAPDGTVVGATTGRPVILLDDLLVALRAAAVPSVISCSIEPTPVGIKRMRSHVRKINAASVRANPDRTKRAIRQQLGPQTISVTGVPDTSHFARVLVAADYRMKRISMNIEPAPIRDLPSYLEMLNSTGRGSNNMLPRWWLEPDYEPLLRDAEGLVWQLRGAAVKTMTENDFLNAAGVKQHTGRADPITQQWADKMTERYEELALADPVFGQLRNCMDLAIVAALIVREDLTTKAGVSLPMLLDATGVQTARFNAPKQLPSEAILFSQGRNLAVACGGVQINAWTIVEKAQQKDSLASIRAEAAIDGDAAWWSN